MDDSLGQLNVDAYNSIMSYTKRQSVLNIEHTHIINLFVLTYYIKSTLCVKILLALLECFFNCMHFRHKLRSIKLICCACNSDTFGKYLYNIIFK